MSLDFITRIDPRAISTVIATSPPNRITKYSSTAGTGSDDTAAFEDAVADCPTTGGVLILPTPSSGEYNLASTLVIDKPLTIIGESGFYPFTTDGTTADFSAYKGAAIKWTGGASEMIRVTNVMGARFENIVLDCANVATHGLVLDRLRYGGASRMAIVRAAEWAMILGSTESINDGAFFNRFAHCLFHGENGIDLNFFEGGSTGAYHNDFQHIQIYYTDTTGYGIRLMSGDNNSFDHVFCFSWPTISAGDHAVYIGPSLVAAVFNPYGSYNQYFRHLECTSFEVADDNPYAGEIIGLDLANSTSDPIIGTGSKLTYTSNGVAFNPDGALWNVEHLIKSNAGITSSDLVKSTKSNGPAFSVYSGNATHWASYSLGRVDGSIDVNLGVSGGNSFGYNDGGAGITESAGDVVLGLTGGATKKVFIGNDLGSPRAHVEIGNSRVVIYHPLHIRGGLAAGSLALPSASSLAINNSSPDEEDGTSVGSAGGQIRVVGGNAGSLGHLAILKLLGKATGVGRWALLGIGDDFVSAVRRGNMEFYDVNALTPRFIIDTDGLMGVGGGYNQPFSSQFQVQTSAAARIAMIIKGAVSQTANLQEWHNSSAAILGVVDSAGKLGIGTSTPRRPMDSLSTSQAQLRLTYTDNSVYTDFTTNSSGNLAIVPTGGLVTVTGTLNATVALQVNGVPVGGSYTDEEAQDAVGTILADSATIDFTYTDATPEITASVKSASITEAMQVLADNTTQDFSTTKHGYVPKGTNVGHFLKDNGSWAVVTAASLSGQVPLANGGTGAALADPNADRLLFWDDSAGTVEWLTLGTNLSISGTTLNAAGGGAGITNSAGSNVVMKSDGTNAIASNITDSGSAIVATASTSVTLATPLVSLTTANSVISGATGLTLEETGDTFGTVKLHLQNRTGVNGAMFEQAGSVDLVDFVFKGLSNQRNIRYEARTSSDYILAPEFQIGDPADPTLIISDKITLTRGVSRILPTPTFDLASSTLGVGQHIYFSSGVTVAAGNTLSLIRVTALDGTNNEFTVGSAGQAGGLFASLTSASGSHATSNTYGAVTHVKNLGPGNTKGLHAMAEAGGSSTGVLVAGNFQVVPIAGTSTAWAIQVSSTGTANQAIGIAFVQTGSSHWLYGLDFVAAGTNTFTNGAMRLINNSYIVAQNNAANADVSLIKINTSDEAEFGTNLRNNIANPILSLGSSSTGWQMQKVDSDGRLRFIKNGVGDILEMQADADVVALAGDLEVAVSSKGLVLKSPDSTRWRVQVTNAGALTITSI